MASGNCDSNQARKPLMPFSDVDVAGAAVEDSLVCCTKA
jgi:hypothetical protein